MPAYVPRLLAALIISLLLLLLTASGLYLLRVERHDAAVTRDIQRTNDLLRWREVLATYQRTNQTFPKPEQSSQILAELERTEQAPRPPVGSGDHYRYATEPDGGVYLMCTVLEQDHESQAWFITSSGQFLAASRYCNSASVRTGNFITSIGLTADAANQWLEIPTRIESKERIREICANNPDASTAIYGCYTHDGNTRRISVLNITDPDLRSQIDVIASHELMHAVYEKLPDNEKASLDQQLAAQAQAPGFEVLAEELSLYSEAERPGELHSRLPTEYNGLSPELEKYYGRYFRNRSSLVAKHEPYRLLLSSIRRLNTRLEQSRQRLEGLRAAGNIEAYNAGVDPYNALVNQYNALANRYNLLTK